MQNAQKQITLKYSDIRLLASIYVLLPVIVFIVCYLRWYFAVVSLCTVVFSLYSIGKDRKNARCSKLIQLRWSNLAAYFIVMLIWCQLGGMNGFMFQTSDWPVRNAIFRDLITHSWPVKYASSDSALVYYIGHWLPAAAAAKTIGAIFNSERIAWFVGRNGLWVWSSIGLLLILMLLFLFSDANTKKKRILVLLVFVFFSGLDIIGVFHNNQQERLFSPDVLHLEWWPDNGYQYTSITACIYWVFNQSIIPWIVTMLFLLDSDERYYIVYAVACIICGPLPLIGLAVLMVVRASCRLYKKFVTLKEKYWFRAVFSFSNISMLMLCVPIFVVYLFSNNAIEATDKSEYITDNISLFSSTYWNKELLVFFLLEVGIYLVLLWNEHKRDPVFYAVTGSLMVIPYFHVGVSTDFCMRASIPGVFITMAYTAKYLTSYLPGIQSIHVEHAQKSRIFKKRIRHVIAILLLVSCIIGACTPCIEIYRGIYNVFHYGSIRLAKDDIGSFDNLETTTNFSTSNPDQKLFFKYLAREN